MISDEFSNLIRTKVQCRLHRSWLSSAQKIKLITQIRTKANLQMCLFGIKSFLIVNSIYQIMIQKLP